MIVTVFDTKPYDRQYLCAGLSEFSEDACVDFHFHEGRLSPELAAVVRPGAVCVFVQDHVNAPVLGVLASKGVELVTLRCAGFNNVDLEAARELGIAVTRVPAYSPYAVAEHAVALLLTLNRRIHRAFNRVREQNFSLHGLVGFDLHGKTAGIVGTGKIGRILAGILSGFGMRLVGCDPFPDAAWASSIGLEYMALEDLLRCSDVVSLHSPLTPETHHMLNGARLELMKPGACLVNTSRGKLVDTRALIQCLKHGHLGGVALDVYEEEEGVFFEDLSAVALHDDLLARLMTFPNVLITAHQAFLTHEALSEISRVTLSNLVAHATNRPFLPGTVLVERPGFRSAQVQPS